MRRNEGRQAHSATDRLALSGPGNTTVQTVEGKSGRLIDGSIIQTSPQPPSFWTCVHREVPARCTSSLVFLDKLFSASLVAPDRTAGINARYKSTLFIWLCSPNIKEASGRLRAVVLDREQHGNSWGQCGKAASEGTLERTKEPAEGPTRSSGMEYCLFFLKTNTQEASPRTRTLKEALELSRPDFINRSKDRVWRMEASARRRRMERRCALLTQDVQRKKCTVPDPHSDMLFKPKQRSISGWEMQQRTRRMYYMLPEVKKRKQEAERKASSQANRVRVHLFKKRLLDNILQR
ncbi:uncharacterized protein LOC130923179 [Corythoichthys intestinalis]|uniref:uncharacterized protein LOC130923179 n=1 Tax=Corythoichthys intestinalis TaxID=161448 RepID=UPI0025A6299D|nr:uncharacterized protein LOC130923179 [Corythoichthys intestinalis]XP_057704676.1 uncharacterized protein LOC130923179 [Corythoichthys intestinalis]